MGVVVRLYSTTRESLRRPGARLDGPFAPADGPHLPAVASAAEEPIAAIGLEPRHADAGRHRERLDDLAGSGIDASQVALVAPPGRVPEFSVDPGDAGDEAVGHDGVENCPCVRIGLIDLPMPIVSDPEGPFGPGEPGVRAVAWRGDRGDDAAVRRVDLLDAILGDLKQVPAVEGGSGVRRGIDR